MVQLKFILFFIQCIYKSDKDQTEPLNYLDPDLDLINIYHRAPLSINPNENIFKSCAMILNIISNTASYSV